MFFQRHTGKPAEVVSLRPHSGGNPEVAAEIETGGSRYRVEKRFLGQTYARITEVATGRVIAQADEAEAWLGRLVTAGGGPSGLLWVRQGTLELQPEGKPEQARMLDARRHLLSSVAGEVDAITGGRRMDRILADTLAAHGALATATSRARAGGPWALVQADLKAAEAELLDLTGKCDRLRDDLAERGQVQRDLARLRDPEAVAARAERRRLAEAALRRAEVKAREVADAVTRLRLAEAEARQADARLAAFDQAVDRRDRAAEALSRLAEAEMAAARAHDAAGTAEQAAQVSLVAAERAEQDLAADLARGHAALQAIARKTEHARLSASLAAAEVARREAEAAEAAAKAIRIDSKSVEHLADLERRRDLARARADASAAQYAIAYDAAAQVRFRSGGRDLAAGAARLQDRVEIEAPGIGRILLVPAPTEADGVEAAGRVLAAALSQADLEDVAQARAVLAQRAELISRAKAARERIGLHAPDGLDTLRTSVAGLVSGDEVPAEAPDIDKLTAAVAAAREAVRPLRIARDTARDHRIAASEQAVLARATAEAAARDLAEAEAALPDLAARPAHRDTLASASLRLTAVLEAERSRHAALLAEAGDLATLQAGFEMADSACRSAETQERRLDDRLIALSSAIGARAEDGIEERKSDLEGRVEALRRRDGAYAAEVAGLDRLRRALETARTAAREQYFEPVRRELVPLLRMLHDDGELVMDDTTLLPRALIRGGVEEDLDILSGGTREQIAVLTRLAFARLLARRGEAVPVVLDDALVFSDDDRIERMFMALHRAAQGQQIIVFTCRQRAFQSLGGDWPEVRITPL